MTQMSAADQHVIHTQEGKWRLLYNERPLAEASTRGFRYGKRFGSTRRLPETGVLTQTDIRQVVLGWQNADESWHLGLILASHLADERGSRWVELVHWPDPDITVFQDLAQTCGQELAQAISVPFYVIPPKASEPPPPPRPLPSLPLQFGHWQMEAIAPEQKHYVINRTRSYVWERSKKIVSYTFWSIVYLAISLATLFSDIGLPVAGTLLPNPQALPYIGIVISASLFAGVLLQFALLSFTVNRFVIDGSRGTISAWSGKSMRWQKEQVEIQSIYISEVAKKREKFPVTEYGEINLHLGGGKFHFVLQHEQSEDEHKTSSSDVQFNRTKAVCELTRDIVHTDLQAGAVYIAEAFDYPVWYDLRIK